MEPPSSSEYQLSHDDDEQWGDSYARHYSPQRQQRHYEQEQTHKQSYASSRGRSRYHTHEHTPSSAPGNHNGGGRPQDHSSSSNTPRRKGNPQSSSPSIDGRIRIQQQHKLEQQQQSPASAQSSYTYTKPDASQPDALTPLSSLSTILLSHQSQVTTTLKLYRQSHSLHRHANDRTTKALEQLREAQAELEHATTAAEFAKEELTTATIQKEEAQDAMKTMCKRVRSLSKSLVNQRVQLVGLSKNMSWNGRLGTIVKMVTDGGSEDVGRWKVRLDRDWRGRDADGIGIAEYEHNNEKHHGDTYDGGSSNVVVAKAENLQLLDEQQHFDAEADANLLERRLSSSKSKSSSSQKRPQKQHIELDFDTTIPHSKSRDPEQEEYDTVQLYILHHGGVPTTSTTTTNYRRTGRDPSINGDVSPVRSTARNSNRGLLSEAAMVTPDGNSNNKNGRRGGSRSYSRERSAASYKDITPASYYKSDNGRYHDSTSPQQQQRQSSTRRQVSPSKDARQQQPSPSKVVLSSQSKSRPPRTSPSQSNSNQNYPTPLNKSDSNSQYDHMSIQQSPSNDSTRISAAFSKMLLSPVSFTPREINPENDGMRDTSSQQWVNEDNRQYDGLEQRRGGGRGQLGNSPAHQFKPLNINPGGGDVVSIAGSFFDEVTSLDKNIALGNDAFGQQQQDDDASDPQLQPYSSHEETVDYTTNGHPLPYIVVLPVDEDDNDNNNPFMSPGYQDNQPPHCVGVQSAGVDHVNGVYLLAYPKDEHGDAIIPQDGESTPPLYFRDGPSIQLQDGREYDMCILRINCPDSPDHVIWFLARVDCDPDCLDVKFSDCYYYCRMLRNDDGCGGEIMSEDDVAPCQRPPSRGWNVPKLPPGVEMLPIATPSCDASSSAMSGMQNHTQQRNGSNDVHQHGLGIMPRQPSDANDSKMSQTTYSKYSI